MAASSWVWRTRVLPAALATAFALLALGMVVIHQQGRQQSLLEIRARRATLKSKMTTLFHLLDHPVSAMPRAALMSEDILTQIHNKCL